MLKVAITGNIGSGKSTVAKVFNQFGVPVYHADIAAKNLYKSEDIKNQLCEFFGYEILDYQNNIDFKKLGNIVFKSVEKLEWLNNFIHPLVKLDFDKWLYINKGEKYIIQEAAILFESGFNKYFDKIIMVTAPEEERIERVIIRDNSNRDLVLSRIKNQMDENLKISKSDFIISNCDTDLVLPQIIKIHSELQKLSEVHC